ncbi:hypothetical protein DXB61_15110 [Parabacteroides merdae]|uniref:Uncharacterized protein n=1 Tax=Parabacteroides merdae TaxID=46503 RepID=A0AB37LRE4_9BACT|nr:hypothetical protein DXB61_15110 [Parabacteroides merdae]RGS96764.1 hypothetical protein DWX56_17470 [Parabacteroides merdae]
MLILQYPLFFLFYPENRTFSGCLFAGSTVHFCDVLPVRLRGLFPVYVFLSIRILFSLTIR